MTSLKIFEAPKMPVWSATVLSVANVVYETNNYIDVPILADAIEDMGYSDSNTQKMVNHCRHEGPHTKGCWVVATILGQPFVPQLDNWEQVYRELGMSREFYKDFSRLNMHCPCGQWAIPMIKGSCMTCNNIVPTLRKVGSQVWTFENNLDGNISQNDRNPANGSYVVSFRAVLEADEENKNQSANQRREQGCKDVTLLERLLLELAYFLTTDKHLDVNRCTACIGSRLFLGGFVPFVGYLAIDHEVNVCCYDLNYCHDFMRARSVISFSPIQNSG